VFGDKTAASQEGMDLLVELLAGNSPSAVEAIQELQI